MRKVISGILPVFMASIVLVACKKETSQTPNNPPVSKYQKPVEDWLLSKKVGLKPAKSENLDLLKENLAFENARVEKFGNLGFMLVVPVKAAVKEKKNLDKSSALDLIIFLDKAEKIISGNLSLFTPASNQGVTAFSKDAYYNILRQGKFNQDGVFNIMRITGELVNRIEFKDHKLYSFANVQSTDSTTRNQRMGEAVCIDWYLITTYHYPDGSTYTEREYVGRTCSCNGGDYMSFCEPGEGGENPPNITEEEDRTDIQGDDAEVMGSIGSDAQYDLNA
jgi:hypothetical protein